MTEKKQRIVWADVLRFVAIFMVVSVHCTDPFNVSPEARSNPEYNLWGSIYGAFLRPCVPLFAMLTGMLLLPVTQKAGAFCRKRILRVLVPFLVWSVLYNMFPWFTGVLGLDSRVLSVMFPYAGDHPSQTLADSLHNVLLIPFNFTTYTVPLWYIYMLIGLYLYLPFFSAWVKEADRRLMRGFLGLWAVSLFLPYGREYIMHYLGGACAWNAFDMLYYFSGFSGYLLLGYYLKGGTRLSGKTTAAVSLLCLAMGYAVTYTGFRHVTADAAATEEQVELFFLYCSPQVVLMTVAWYLLVQRVRIRSQRTAAALANLTQCGLGIYMIHYFVVGAGYLLVDTLRVPVALRIPATALLVFSVSWAVVAAFYRWQPRAAHWIMG